MKTTAILAAIAALTLASPVLARGGHGHGHGGHHGGHHGGGHHQPPAPQPDPEEEEIDVAAGDAAPGPCNVAFIQYSDGTQDQESCATISARFPNHF